MKTDDIRSSFLEFFRKRGHVIERSDKIVPSNDPTLLFTSAGMVQFKPYYTGETAVPYRRVATSQKCLRAGGKANDLDEVGKTARHMTFFEMLGNFSFGDYFKREAIEWAWEYATDVLKLPGDRIWVSVYTDDDEAAAIWEQEIGVPASRIVRMGDKDNFWGPAGDTGACGPCSELHLDRGESYSEGVKNPSLDNDPGGRFMEFWNLVFPQFDQQPDGSRPPLKNRGIDTGMGLERLAALLQGTETVFDIDIVLPIIRSAESLSKVSYEAAPMAYRVIADHSRALAFLIADGILPSNEGRGYVERRLLRRAARFGREIGLEEPFLYKVAQTVIELMHQQYPELAEKRIQIERIIHTEEERFRSTLARGMDILDSLFARLEQQGERVAPGRELFKLHDTYGFPLDLASDIALDRGFEVDRAGFDAAMAEQREKARSAWSGSGEEAIAPVYRELSAELSASKFLGYETLNAPSKVLAVIKDGARVDGLSEGQAGEVVLDHTPFYAEAGGQVADTGILDAPDCSACVTHVKRTAGNLIVHQVEVLRGALRAGEAVTAQVDAEARSATMCHHTATHLLQAALRNILGDHVHQAGSLVAPDRLRFDFTHFEGISLDRLEDIEREVNAYIRTDTPIITEIMPLEEARKQGAMALFGEKYEDTVRVVKADDISMELCGGTHVRSTGEIGYFKILSESAISAGVRRVEAVCGAPCVDTLLDHERRLHQAAALLHAPAGQIEDRLRQLIEENKRLQREVAKWKQAAATGGAVDYLSQLQDVDGVKVLATKLDGQDAAGLRLAMDKLREQVPSGVLVLGSDGDGKASLCVAVSKDLVGVVKAGDVVKALAPLVGGGGGGRPEMAQAGGKHPEKVEEAIRSAPNIIKELIAG